MAEGAWAQSAMIAATTVNANPMRGGKPMRLDEFDLYQVFESTGRKPRDVTQMKVRVSVLKDVFLGKD